MAAGWQASPAPPAPSTPPPLIRLVRPPDLAMWDTRAMACARQVGMALYIVEVGWDRLVPSRADVLLTWGEPENPEDRIFYRVGTLSAQVIVHVSRRNQPVDLSLIRALYHARLPAEGKDPARWQPLLPLPGHPVYRALARLMDSSLWNPEALWMPSPRWGVQYVALHREALGWIPEGWPRSRAVVVRFLPSEVSGPWPVLAGVSEPPAGPLQAWLACMQYR